MLHKHQLQILIQYVIIDYIKLCKQVVNIVLYVYL